MHGKFTYTHPIVALCRHLERQRDGLKSAADCASDLLYTAIAERDEAREQLAEWRILNGWGGTPEIINEFIKGQQTRIQHAQNVDEELAAARAEIDEIHATNGRSYNELNKVTEQRDMLAKALEKVSRSWNYVEVARDAIQSLINQPK
jgi:archaellum component FlaC